MRYYFHWIQVEWGFISCIFTACDYIIGVLCSQTLRLHFVKFDLEYGRSSCPFDKLKVYDGSNSRGALRGTYCGTKTPDDILSKGKEMFVTFTTDLSVKKSGFEIRFSVGKTIFPVHVNQECST